MLELFSKTRPPVEEGSINFGPLSPSREATIRNAAQTRPFLAGLALPSREILESIFSYTTHPDPDELDNQFEPYTTRRFDEVPGFRELIAFGHVGSRESTKGKEITEKISERARKAAGISLGVPLASVTWLGATTLFLFAKPAPSRLDYTSY